MIHLRSRCFHFFFLLTRSTHRLLTSRHQRADKKKMKLKPKGGDWLAATEASGVSPKKL